MESQRACHLYLHHNTQNPHSWRAYSATNFLTPARLSSQSANAPLYQLSHGTYHLLPYHIGIIAGGQCSGIGKGTYVLANHIWLAIIMFELNPPNLLGQFAEFFYQNINVSYHNYRLFKINHRNILIGYHIVAVCYAITLTIKHVRS